MGHSDRVPAGEQCLAPAPGEAGRAGLQLATQSLAPSSSPAPGEAGGAGLQLPTQCLAPSSSPAGRGAKEMTQQTRGPNLSLHLSLSLTLKFKKKKKTTKY